MDPSDLQDNASATNGQRRFKVEVRGGRRAAGRAPHAAPSRYGLSAYDRPHADGSPIGTLGPQSPAPAGSDPLASDNGVPSAENGAVVSSRSVPKRSSFGVWYMTSPTGSRLSLAIGTPA